MRDAVILQVDDNEDVLLVVKRAMLEAGYQYMSAKTAAKGLRKALQQKPDLVILDYYLDDMSGLELIEKFAEYTNLKNTPTLILSGKSDFGSELKEYYQLGLRAVLKKPFGYRELVNVVENFLELEALFPRGTQKASIVEWKSSEIDPEWLEEMRIATETIACLSGDFFDGMGESVGEKAKMDICAIHNASRRLLKLLATQNISTDVISPT